MSYLRYLCLLVYRGSTHIRCVLFLFVLCTLCYRFLWIVNFILSLRYSLTFIVRPLAIIQLLVVTCNVYIFCFRLLFVVVHICFLFFLSMHCLCAFSIYGRVAQ